jgi:hypothetical protein
VQARSCVHASMGDGPGRAWRVALSFRSNKLPERSLLPQTPTSVAAAKSMTAVARRSACSVHRSNVPELVAVKPCAEATVVAAPDIRGPSGGQGS